MYETYSGYNQTGWGTFVEDTLVECTFVEGKLVEWNIGRTELSSNGTFVEEHLSKGKFV